MPLLIQNRISRKNKSVYLLDSLIILLNISSSYSIIPYVLFSQFHRGINLGLIIIINVLYLCFRFGKNIKFPTGSLFNLYFVLNLINLFSSLITSTGLYMPFLYLLLNTTFYFILKNCFLCYKKEDNFENAFWYIIRGYIWLCVICIVSVLSLFVLIKLGVNCYVNTISNKMDLFTNNVSDFGHVYYFPYGISILLVTMNSMRIPFFADKGIVCGIYHEPHILTFMLFPALFLLLWRLKSFANKLFVFLWSLFIMLIAASVTNILVFICCVFVLLVLEKKSRIFILPIFVFLILSMVFYVGLENTDLFFVEDKLMDSGGSKGYSMSTIEFAFTPKSFLGSNYLSNSYINDVIKYRDVGYLPFLLNISFLILFVYKICKVLLKYKCYKFVGLSVLYFFIHSMKIAMVTYSLSFLMFMIFIVSVISSVKQTDS